MTSEIDLEADLSAAGVIYYSTGAAEVGLAYCDYAWSAKGHLVQNVEGSELERQAEALGYVDRFLKVHVGCT